MLLVLGEQFLRIFIVHTWVDDNMISLLPVDRGGDLVLIAKLERVDYTKDLIRVGNGQADHFLRVDHKDRSDLIAPHVGQWHHKSDNTVR